MSYESQQANQAVSYFEFQEAAANEREININHEIPLQRAALLKDPQKWSQQHMSDPEADLLVIFKLAIVNEKDPMIIGEAVTRILENRLREAAETELDYPSRPVRMVAIQDDYEAVTAGDWLEPGGFK